MVVQHNITAMNAGRMLGITTSAQSKQAERLSSGYRINRAGDDAAGLKISEKMRSQIRGLEKASTNAQDGVSLIQTAEGALNEAHSILQRMNELAVQGANDTNQGIDREAINEELAALTEELDRIADTTEFNKQKLLDGNYTAKKLHVGANKNQYISITIKGMNASAIGLNAQTTLSETKASYMFSDKTGLTKADAEALRDAKVASITKASDRIVAVMSGTCIASYTYNGTGGVTKASYNDVLASAQAAYEASVACIEATNISVTWTSTDTVSAPTVSTYEKAQVTLSKVQDAINKVSSQRSALGALQNRLEHTIANLDNVAENTQAAESRIRDTDMAEAMVEYSKNQILAQAGQSMLAQANQSTQGVLSLLQ